MAQTILGRQTFTEQPGKRRKSLGGGWEYVQIWHGPRADLVAQLAYVESLDPAEINVTDGTPCVIEATFSTSEDNPDDSATWELIWTPIEKPLGTHGYFQPNSGNAIALGAQEAIRKAVRDGTAYDTDFDAIYTSQGFRHGNDFRNLLLKGTDSWRTWLPTIRKTYSVPASQNGIAQTTNLDFRHAQAVIPYAQIGLPANPGWVQPYLRLYDPAISNWSIRLFAEWLEAPANIVYGKRKFNITQEWIGAVKWYSVLYDVFSGGGADTTTTGFE